MVIGFCEVIADSPRVYGTLPRALMADIAAIRRNGQHLMALVNDVLNLSQIEAGRMALSKDWTMAHEILEGSPGAVKALFESKGLYLEGSIQEAPIPMFCASLFIRFRKNWKKRRWWMARRAGDSGVIHLPGRMERPVLAADRAE
jgi:signal transduction histidine kinase